MFYRVHLILIILIKSGVVSIRVIFLDLYSRQMVGWCINKRMKKSLVIRALMRGINLRKPRHRLMHHSDRGCQYANQKYQALYSQHGLIASMNRKV